MSRATEGFSAIQTIISINFRLSGYKGKKKKEIVGTFPMVSIESARLTTMKREELNLHLNILSKRLFFTDLKAYLCSVFVEILLKNRYYV